MRSKFVGDASIYCFEVEWPSPKLSWKDFRGKLLGPTDPAKAPDGSLRKEILTRYKELGLTSEPNQGDNGVHASASPFEGLAEKVVSDFHVLFHYWIDVRISHLYNMYTIAKNWLGKSIEDDVFGTALIDSGLTRATIEAWSLDPRIKQPDGSEGSVFDALEDMDAADCVVKLVELNKLNT